MNLKCGYFTVGGIMCGSLVGIFVGALAVNASLGYMILLLGAWGLCLYITSRSLMRRKDAPSELADRRAILTCEIAKLRKEDKIAEGAIKRIQRTRESNRIDQENRSQHTNNRNRRRDRSRQR